MNDIFSAADILLPDFGKTDAKKWSVIACDQFTGDPAYWEKTAAEAGSSHSTLNLILPECIWRNRTFRRVLKGSRRPCRITWTAAFSRNTRTP